MWWKKALYNDRTCINDNIHSGKHPTKQMLVVQTDTFLSDGVHSFPTTILQHSDDYQQQT